MAESESFFVKPFLEISFHFEDDCVDNDSPNGENSSGELAVGGRMSYGLFAYIVGKRPATKLSTKEKDPEAT